MAVREMTNELHVAAVFAHDGIRLLTASHSEAGVTERLAAYIQGQADLLLWPGDARRVRALLEVGDTEEAIDLYFARVGERWEREHLHREGIETADPTEPHRSARPA
jgi:hypothetical protein